MINLFDFQKEILEKTKDRNRVAYYLDMGLGKTFVGSEKLMSLNSKYNLIVCQKSKINDWFRHFCEFYGVGNIIFNLTNKREFEEFLNFPNCDQNLFGIINYDLVWRRERLGELKNFSLLLDESSQIKNERVKKSKFILKLNPDNVILLSGTPVSGKYEELWSQVKLLGWDISKRDFYSDFIIEKAINVGIGFPIKIVVGYKNIPRLKRRLRQYGAVFLKTEDVIDLPEQVEQEISVENIKEYKRFKKDGLLKIDGRILAGQNELTRLLYLRKLASEFNKNKITALKDLIESTNDRLIIFYNFNDELKILKEIIKDRPASEINGSKKDLKNYETKDDSITLIQYQAGSMGLNLQKANKIIYFSLPLSSEHMEQSKKRTHRVGQDKTCFYYYLITKDSIDEEIFKVLKQRKDYTNALFKESDRK